MRSKKGWTSPVKEMCQAYLAAGELKVPRQTKTDVAAALGVSRQRFDYWRETGRVSDELAKRAAESLGGGTTSRDIQRGDARPDGSHLEARARRRREAAHNAVAHVFADSIPSDGPQRFVRIDELLRVMRERDTLAQHVGSNGTTTTTGVLMEYPNLNDTPPFIHQWVTEDGEPRPVRAYSFDHSATVPRWTRILTSDADE